MNGALLVALERIEREKGISKEVLFEAIESALVSAAKKAIDDPSISKEDIEVVINRESGQIEVYSEGIEVRSEKFGRIAAQTAKQVMIQKIREAEREVIFEKYQKKVGTIISGAVHRFERGNIIVELDNAEAMVPRSEQIPRERFRQGETLRAYLKSIEKAPSGPVIILSRSDKGFVKKLFELEVPEISQGIVEIRAIARESGDRTKIAVYSKDEKVDPVGACVGMRGSRVRDIVKELNGERIDIIRWSEDIRELLPAAVSPAEISRMVIDRENRNIIITVPQDQLSLLIGKKGRNIRLASKLVGWELSAEGAREEVDISLSDVEGITPKMAEGLAENGYDNVNKILESGKEALLLVEGIGEKTAEKVVDICEKAYKKEIDLRHRKEETPEEGAQESGEAAGEEDASEREESGEAAGEEDASEREESGEAAGEEDASEREESGEAAGEEDASEREESGEAAGEEDGEDAK
jgi:N utilization substance protein A